jgi:GT2 family glycosyltransferase
MIVSSMAEAPEVAAPLKTSVIIVSYNSAAALRRCLAALERVLYRESIEIIVIDAGSRDDTAEVEHEFPQATFLKLPRNFGRTKARNIGIRTATGEFILFLDPAVEVDPDTIAPLAARLEADNDAAAVCPLLVDDSGQPAIALRTLPRPDNRFQPAPRLLPSFDNQPLPVECPPDSALMVRKYFVRGLNYLDERYGNSWSDIELCYQIRRAGKKILLLPAAKGVWHAEDAFEPDTSAARALIAADSELGRAAFAAKHSGWLAGVGLRVRSTLSAFASLFALSDFAYRFARFRYLLSGQRVDGTQSVL